MNSSFRKILYEQSVANRKGINNVTGKNAESVLEVACKQAGYGWKRFGRRDIPKRARAFVLDEEGYIRQE